MKAYRRLALLAVLVLLIGMMVIPVSAVRPDKSSLGHLIITSNGEDIQRCMAVCIEEEDGCFVYSGNRPIQQQVGAYWSITSGLDYNTLYDIEEDTEYDAAQGVFRFELKESLDSGEAADVFPKMEAVKKGDTVYFVYWNENGDEPFPMEKTTVKSVQGGVLTTVDKLEKDIANGDFTVIFNDSGDVVGFCKSGVATAPISKDSGITYLILIGAAALAAVLIVVLVLTKKTTPAPVPVPGQFNSQWSAEEPALDDATMLDGDNIPGPAYLPGKLALKCHGGYLNGRTYPIPKEGITIGREPDNTIRYPAQTPGISRHHVKLYWQNGQLMLADMGSSNGTYMKQSGRIASLHPVSLNPGDVFYLGEKLNGFEISTL